MAKAIIDQTGRGCGWSGLSALAGRGWKTLGVAQGWYEAGPLALREQPTASYQWCRPGAVKVSPAESKLIQEKDGRDTRDERPGRKTTETPKNNMK